MRRLLPALAALLVGTLAAQEAPAKPDILIILADDMGYSDLGCYGGEIPTPNLDALAQDGVRLAGFHSQARCCPSRASIVTGQHPQQVGTGHMTESSPLPGYRAALAHPHTSIAAVAAAQGYCTAISGKWHLSPGDPQQQGFSITTHVNAAGGCYFYPFDREWVKRDAVPAPPAGVPSYVTDWYGDGVIEAIEASAQQKKPFLIYWAPTAPHYPLQCREQDRAPMRGRYDAGPRSVAEARMRRLRELKLIEPEWPFVMPKAITAPDLSWRADVRTDADAWPPAKGTQFANPKSRAMGCARRAVSFAEMMEIYAGQVIALDKQVGRVVDRLKKEGRYDNTLILFSSDNGASDEPQGAGPVWAQVSNMPYPGCKASVDGGGVRSPAIACWPKRIPANRRGAIERGLAFLPDVLPTVVEACGGTMPETDEAGKPLPQHPGRSLLPLIEGRGTPLAVPYCFEHEGNLAVVTEQWKLVNRRRQPWRLYNLTNDPLETRDCASSQPAVVRELATAWQAWADAVNARVDGRIGDRERLNPDTLQP